MAETVERGQDGTQLPEECRVLRAFEPKDPRLLTTDITISDFVLSSSDRKEDPPLFSVFEETLTGKANTCALVGKTGRSHRVVARFAVAQIREITLPPYPGATEEAIKLDVIWSAAIRYLPDGSTEEDTRPGANGHAGILGLLTPKRYPGNLFERAVRQKLADLANQDKHMVTHHELEAILGPETSPVDTPAESKPSADDKLSATI